MWGKLMNRWFISRQGKLKGPFSLQELQQQVRTGELESGDLVCPEGGAPTTASRVAGLFDQESPRAAPVAATSPTGPISPAKATPVSFVGGMSVEPVLKKTEQLSNRSQVGLQENAEETEAAFGMSRLVYWGAMLGGWSALIGWGIAEFSIGHRVNDSLFFAVVMVVSVGATLGVGLSQVGGLAAFQGKKQLVRLGPGLLGGLVGGIVGGLLGNLLFYLLGSRLIGLTFAGRVLGWTLLGIAIGTCEGLLERNWRKIRNGLIGGTLGGLIGGVIFNPVSSLIGSPVSSRAFAFVAVGLCLGMFISLVEVLMKEAWLTVEDGFRPGRQLILKDEVTTMGTSEKAGLIFIAYGAKGVEPMHVRICRQNNGAFTVEDLNSRTGTLVNGEPVKISTQLSDGDVIEFGVNKVRFNSRHVASHTSDRIASTVR